MHNKIFNRLFYSSLFKKKLFFFIEMRKILKITKIKAKIKLLKHLPTKKENAQYDFIKIFKTDN